MIEFLPESKTSFSKLDSVRTVAPPAMAVPKTLANDKTTILRNMVSYTKVSRDGVTGLVDGLVIPSFFLFSFFPSDVAKKRLS